MLSLFNASQFVGPAVEWVRFRTGVEQSWLQRKLAHLEQGENPGYPLGRMNLHVKSETEEHFV